jgi:hypothetical protein
MPFHTLRECVVPGSSVSAKGRRTDCGSSGTTDYCTFHCSGECSPSSSAAAPLMAPAKAPPAAAPAVPLVTARTAGCEEFSEPVFSESVTNGSTAPVYSRDVATPDRAFPTVASVLSALVLLAISSTATPANSPIAAPATPPLIAPAVVAPAIRPLRPRCDWLAPRKTVPSLGSLAAYSDPFAALTCLARHHHCF